MSAHANMSLVAVPRAAPVLRAIESAGKRSFGPEECCTPEIVRPRRALEVGMRCTSLMCGALPGALVTFAKRTAIRELWGPVR